MASSPASASGTRSRLLLIGMMGSGKSTVGRLLATRLGWPYLDSDEQVERNTGRTVLEILETDGEKAFRAEEKRSLAQAVTRAGPAVVSVAGGAILDPDNRRRLRRAGTVVWLRARVPTLAARVGSGEGRPLLAGDPEGNLRRIYRRRRAIYHELAHEVVDVDALTPVQVADAVLRKTSFG